MKTYKPLILNEPRGINELAQIEIEYNELVEQNKKLQAKLKSRNKKQGGKMSEKEIRLKPIVVFTKKQIEEMKQLGIFENINNSYEIKIIGGIQDYAR
ncbi:MAG: hypothetical protein WCY19_05125 [Candidatus Gastranaerophilaceae bacterium]